MKTILGLALVATGLAALSTTSAMAAKDNFNRSTLGNKWVVTSGSLFITNDQLQGTSESLGYDKKSGTDSTVSADVYINSTDLEYGAVASGDIAGGNNAFVKIQAQAADGMFDTAGFYVGNNGGGDFFTLTSEVPSPAKLTVSFCGTVATMKIKSAAGTQKYTYDYGTSFGTGGGLGTYGSVSLDNYKSKVGGCAFDPEATVIKRSNARDLSLAK
ncbi:MAG TPA: hypothetical protein VGL35_03635 [Rhizomicrobium sp.]|jgi:hypothetical protein